MIIHLENEKLTQTDGLFMEVNEKKDASSLVRVRGKYTAAWFLYHHYHQGVLTAYIPLILFFHPSLSVIALGKSSRRYPVFV